MAIYKCGKGFEYESIFSGQQIRAGTKQGNQRLAEQIRAALKLLLARAKSGSVTGSPT